MCLQSDHCRVGSKGAEDGNGVFEVRNKIGGEVLGTIPVENFNYWTDVPSDIALPDGVSSLFFTFNGSGNPDFAGF